MNDALQTEQLETPEMSYAIYQVGVVGGGTMGGGIAALVARQGLPVIVKEANEELGERARQQIDARFQKWYDSHKIDEHRLRQLVSLVEVTTSLEDLARAQLIIEAVPEQLELKRSVFKQLEATMAKDVIIASNTSSIPITDLGRMTLRADRVAGMHFFNPPTRMALVELVKGKDTSEETIAILNEFARSTLQKMTISVADRPGFLVNCLLLPYLNEALLGLEEATVSPESIDAEARAFGWPMGPFTLLDVIGLDTALTVAEFLSRSYADRMNTGSLLPTLVGMNRLGDKSGAGFYVTSDQEPIESILARLYPHRHNKFSAPQIFERMMSGFLNEAVRALDEHVASKEDIELGAQAGLGCPKGGPLHIIDAMGHAGFLSRLQMLEQEYGRRFHHGQLLQEKAHQNRKFFDSW